MRNLTPVFVFFAIVWPSAAANFSGGTGTAAKFGVHEIVLSGNSSVANPFDTVVNVIFTPAFGSPVNVRAFYDGGDIWRARVYVSESGEWRWTSTSKSDSRLANKSGSFQALDSSLRGILRNHRSNPKVWMTDNGQWFPNISDTGYRLFHGKVAPDWKEFIRQSAAKGIDCMRVAALGGWGGTPGAKVDDNNTWVWNDPWTGAAIPNHDRYDVGKFQTTDERLIWSLENHPEMYFQMILFSFKGYGSEATGSHWEALPQAVRENTMRYMIARWSAFPNVFWLIVNDMHCSEKFPKNQTFVREVGKFFFANDPWHHLISTGPNRHAGFPFTTDEDLKWCSYIYIEDSNAVGADQIQTFKFDRIPLHVWMGEDYYEQDHGHYLDPRYYFRWLAWSWLLSGGSANYCGRWGSIDPYDSTGSPDRLWSGIDKKTVYTGEKLIGLDSYPYLVSYLRDRKLDLSSFQPNDARVRDGDGRQGRRRPKLMQRRLDEFLIYHPNALADGYSAVVDREKAASVILDLKDASGEYEVEWCRALDGAAQRAGSITAGRELVLQAPWHGQDVVLRLKR